MKTLKMFKKLNFRKTKVVAIEDMFIPVRTISIAEENSIKINIPCNIPSKVGVLNAKDLAEIKKLDKEYNPLTYPAVRTYDKTSKEWIKYEEDVIKYSPILDGVKYINFEYKEVGDDKTFLENLIDNGLPKMTADNINWIEVCMFFESIGITDNIINDIIVAVKALKGENVYEKLSKISTLVGMDYITLITHLENMTDLYDTIKANETTIDELYEKIKELEESKLAILKNQDAGVKEVVEESGNEGI